MSRAKAAKYNKLQIRNSKSEIRNNFKWSKNQKVPNEPVSDFLIGIYLSPVAGNS